MAMPENGKIKRYRRFAGWDYTKGASLFITIATEPRRALFGRIVNGSVLLSPLGEKVKEAVEAIPLLNPGIMLFGHVVMPDHIHFNCALMPGLREPLKVLGNAIRRFKNYTTTLARLAEHSSAIKASYGEVDSAITASGGVSDSAINAGATGNGKGAPSNDGRAALGQLWQQGYHDYILISREMIDSTERYIAYNPLKWELMYGVKGALRVIEPLSVPTLPMGEWWTGVGRADWLAEGGAKLAAVRLSRRLPQDCHESVAARLLAACDKGYTLAGTWISPCEQLVFDRLVELGRPILRASPKPLVSVYRPVREEPSLFAAGRYLLLSRVAASGVAAGVAWHGFNDALGQIALASGGTSVYVQPDATGGVRWEFAR